MRRTLLLVIVLSSVTGLALAQDARRIGALRDAPAASNTTPGEATAIRELLAEIAALRHEVERLRQRVGRLEARLELAPVAPTTAAPASWSALPRHLQVERIATLEVDPAEFVRVDQLNREADALEQTADSLRRQMTNLTGSTSRSGGRGGVGTRDNTDERRRRALAELMSDYRMKARAKRGEALRLKRHLEEPRQEVHGANAERTVVLRTTRDLSCVLDKVAPGDLLTWDGRRLALDEERETWEVPLIEIVESAEVAAAVEEAHPRD